MLKVFRNILFLFFSSVQPLWPSCNPAQVPNTYRDGFVPFTFLNWSGDPLVSDERVYVTFVATPSDSLHYFLKFQELEGEWVAYPVFVTDTKVQSEKYSYPISQFSKGKTPFTVYIPTDSRVDYQLFFSIDYPMSMRIGYNDNRYLINIPDPMNVSDSNYYHIYDGSVRFSASKTTPGLNIRSDYTACFALPISVSVAYNGEYNTLLLGMNINRKSVFAAYGKELEQMQNPQVRAEWEKLVCSFVSAGAQKPSNLRLFSLHSMASNGKFAKDFLYSDRFGKDWEASVFIPKSLQLDVSLCDADVGYERYVLSNVTPQDLQFAPTRGGDPVTISRPIPLSAFVNGDSGSLGFNITGDGKAGPYICRLLGAGFVTGYLPNSFLGPDQLASANAKGSFFATPFCDLYSKVLHTLASPTVYTDFLTVPVDDLTPFYNGTTIPINKQTKPWVFVTLEDTTGTIFPNFMDDALYDLTFPAPPDSMEMYYNDQRVETTQTFHKQKMPFKLSIKYLKGIYNNGITYESTTYVHNTNDPRGFSYGWAFPCFPIDVAFIPGATLYEWTIAPGSPE